MFIERLTNLCFWYGWFLTPIGAVLTLIIFAGMLVSKVESDKLTAGLVGALKCFLIGLALLYLGYSH